MNNIKFATFRLGKTSIQDIQALDKRPAGIQSDAYSFVVTCTQVPDELTVNTVVFIWLGSDNSKGIPTEWKQGFKGVGIVKALDKAEKYNDESHTTIELKYIFGEAVNRLDILRESPSAYFWCSSLPIIGLDDHSNQTVRILADANDRSKIGAFLYALNAVQLTFRDEIVSAIPDMADCFWDSVVDPKTGVQIGSVGFVASDDTPRQLITYGAPGTGKSFRTKKETKGHAVYRTTFHPDSDYSTFVGAYKPTMSEDAGRIEVYKGSGSSKVLDVTHEVKKGISYDFVPQAFIKAYVDAWKKVDAVAEGETPDPVFLVIEEINRGNCAQIFGDLFQLLDRDDDGYSDYPIDTDADLKRFLSDAKQLGNLSKIREDVRTGVKLVLPPNLYIRATMNTSDQSLFPIDSAFKRRWEWKYVPIAKPTEAGWTDRVIVADGKAYDWWEFLKIANKQILDTTKSEDKQLGYFFVKAPDATGYIKAERFAGKVLFYLYNDVFKDYTLPAALFGDGSGGSTKFEFKMFFDEHGEPKENVVAAFLDQLKVPNAPLSGSTTTIPETASAE